MGKVEGLIDFRSVSTGIGEQVKNALRQSIVTGRMKPGDKLPSEDNMAEQFKVSKTAIREALGQLVAEGLIEKRRGAMGGSFVAHGDSRRILEAVVDCYRLGGITLENVIQYRRMVEPMVARLACEQRTVDDLGRIEKNLAHCRGELGKDKVDRQSQVEFHGLVADATQNPLLAASLRAALKISREFTMNLPFSLEDGRLDFQFNLRVAECLRTRDGDQAKKVMEEHFEESRILVERYQARQNKK